jgi:hypothetical protein
VAARALRAAVNAAVAEGASAADVARTLEITRPDADALVAELERERGPDGQLPDDAYAVAERYAVGELSRAELIETLTGWTYAPDRVMKDYWDDLGVTREGSFRATVARALSDGLIDTEAYDTIRRGRRGAS